MLNIPEKYISILCDKTKFLLRNPSLQYLAFINFIEIIKNSNNFNREKGHKPEKSEPNPRINDEKYNQIIIKSYPSQSICARHFQTHP